MHLLPVTITILKDESSIGQKDIANEVAIIFEVEVRGVGDFSEFVVNGQIDSGKIANRILSGQLIISRYSK